MTEMRICKTCNVDKPITRYGLSDGYARRSCKECETARKRDWNKINGPKRAAVKRMARRLGPSPLHLTYRKGERCWCCRREATRGMLCRTCYGDARRVRT